MRKIVSTENLSYEEWLQLRKTGIGGSDAAVILGISPFKSTWELWNEKVKELQTLPEETEAAYWGKLLEPVVREEFTARTGLRVYIEPYLLQHNQYSFMQANLDGFLYDPVYGNCIFEAKTASAYKAGDWDEGVPDEYYAQLQHYMAVTGYQGAYIAALIGGNHFIWKFVERDKPYIRKLIQKEKLFWHHVETETEPPIDGTKPMTAFLDSLYPKVEDQEVLQLDEDEQQWIDLYLDAKQKETAAKEQKQLAENRLKGLLQKHEKAVLGAVEINWPEIVSEKFDSKQMKRDEPELYEQYVYKVQYRKFAVKCRKGAKTDE